MDCQVIRAIRINMKVFMIGGTGLLGCAAAQLFIDKGHTVKSVALPPLPEGAPIPPEMELVWGNYLEMTDDEIKAMMSSSPRLSTRIMKNTTSIPSSASSVWQRIAG